MFDSPVDLLILSNGPGEISTWVRPVVKRLRQNLTEDRSLLRISVILSPCTHSMGAETELNNAFIQFKEMADRKKEITDRDLEAIVNDDTEAR